ncbi:uncharacterized protein LOC125646255 [Ostrea edulis]|uniref:uncharacterized protein LOC125646255 n=1 Tax=Ostrea edulis TaxID=37623 RepID=UPI0024AFC5BA|nr:uncharacterized protein LOC125646255 [Ostrea edulis]
MVHGVIGYWSVFRVGVSFIVLCTFVESYKELCDARNLNCEKWKDYMLEEHNRVRKAASAILGLLTWSKSLEKHALEYAQTCKGAHSDYVMRKDESGLACTWIGENGWSGYRSPGDDATKAFENEEKYWNHATQKCNLHWTKCGHYKQVISPKTCMLGCGRAKCGDHKRKIWCWYATNCRSCQPDKKRELLQLIGLRSENELEDFMRSLNNQTMPSPVSPPPSISSSGQAVTGVDTSESGEESDDVNDSVETT